MRAFIKNKINLYFNSRGFSICKNELKDYPIKALKEFSSTPLENKIDSIIFSKDRAIQLHAFIESYFKMVINPGTLYVLYKAVGDHVESYEELKNIWGNKDVVFIQEFNFRQQLIDVCRQSNAKLIGFYVDDMIFTDKVSYSDILSYNPLEYIVCLSRGCDFTYSQVLNKTLELPDFTEISDGNGFYSFSWDYSDEFSDWTYPLGVSAYFYSRAEVVAMLESIDFKAPNSLEASMQLMMPYFKCRKGLCKDKITCTIVPVNIVQEECLNPVTGYVTIEELLAIWNKGLKIDTAKFYGVGAKGIHMNYEYIDRF